MLSLVVFSNIARDVSSPNLNFKCKKKKNSPKYKTPVNSIQALLSIIDNKLEDFIRIKYYTVELTRWIVTSLLMGMFFGF